MEGSSLLPPLMMMKGDFFDVEKKILPRRCRDVFTVVKAHSNLR